ncbi:hypothetical protein EJ05DRAFT_38746 [Pseudovirgaria hyperparasitica]|uniref:Uncharacterized protein n=1 Tax=Pseudovirgaria hyperparasitica TaxID=470096 RepID=A0A6A6WN20_9PEZI|nr:uncharacterized protein EJ05DRAFT_38746 [Pseudovirgaria hyperparasitica]KAF2763439.1 hypothetical protein EJ05DRAFT_38746 [Pseudovirgaria hyperparasitica]
MLSHFKKSSMHKGRDQCFYRKTRIMSENWRYHPGHAPHTGHQQRIAISFTFWTRSFLYILALLGVWRARGRCAMEGWIPWKSGCRGGSPEEAGDNAMVIHRNWCRLNTMY